jgi:hypothetical protein
MFNFTSYRNNREQRRQAKDAFDAAKADIDRERDLLNPRTIFLKDSFFKYAVEPALLGDHSFEEKFGNCASVMKDWFSAINTAFHQYELSYFHLRGQDKQDALKEITAYANRVAHNRIQSLGNEVDALYWRSQQVSKEQFCEKLIEQRKHLNKYSGVRLRDIAAVMIQHDYFKFEDEVIKKGESTNIVAFWKSLRSLEDYQCYFPEDHNSGSGNNKDERNKLKELIEGLNPLPA